MASRMKEKYVSEIAPALNKKFGYKSVTMILTVDGDATDVQIFVRVSEVPADIKDNALSPVDSEE